MAETQKFVNRYQTTCAPYEGELYTLKVGDWKFQRPEIDPNKCSGCGICWFSCPTHAIRKKDTQYQVDLEWCKGCGICAAECQVKAIDMVRL
ncbi:MAG: 4Fe-4S binding protein [Chloroflexi bacterium]|nr:4Fe-4S binding protein [Chloroflexota bacterium]